MNFQCGVSHSLFVCSVISCTASLVVIQPGVVNARHSNVSYSYVLELSWLHWLMRLTWTETAVLNLVGLSCRDTDHDEWYDIASLHRLYGLALNASTEYRHSISYTILTKTILLLNNMDFVLSGTHVLPNSLIQVIWRTGPMQFCIGVWAPSGLMLFTLTCKRLSFDRVPHWC